MRRVAVIGVGTTKFGKHDRTSAELFAAAVKQADREAQILLGLRTVQSHLPQFVRAGRGRLRVGPTDDPGPLRG